MPECKTLAIGSFALVPLCQNHLTTVQKETRRYYGSNARHAYEDARPLYMQIAGQIPWSKPMMDLKYGTDR
jgi:hypothetical protein